MSARSESLVVPVPPAKALAACRRSLSPEVWELEEEGADRLVANEWPWRISCQTRPARIEIHVEAATDDQTTLRLNASVSGYGPVAANHLRNHLEGLKSRIRNDAAARETSRRPRGQSKR